MVPTLAAMRRGMRLVGVEKEEEGGDRGVVPTLAAMRCWMGSLPP